MQGLDYQAYFLQPREAAQRRYEALRSVFVQQCPLKEVAGQFGVSYGTIRNWVSEFCRRQDAGQPPPFSRHHRVGVPRSTKFPPTPRKSRLPMPRRYPCSPVGG